MIMNRLEKIIKSTGNDDYFIVFSSLFDVLGVEQSIDSFNFRNKQTYNIEEKIFCRGIFEELLNLDSMSKKEDYDGNFIYAIEKNGEPLVNIFPYFVDEGNEFGDIPNVGNRGFAGKLRDSFRTGKVILIFDIDPIGTLSSASDSEVLMNIFSKESLKYKMLNNSNAWVKELGDAMFNDNLQPHIINIIDRINLLLLMKTDNNNVTRDNINALINEYRLPLFYLDTDFEEGTILENYKKFLDINNNFTERNTNNFYKGVVEKLHTGLIPESVGERNFINILKSKNLLSSNIYDFEELTYKTISRIIEEKPSVELNRFIIEIENGSPIEAIDKGNKLGIFFINSVDLQKLKVKIAGNIIQNQSVYMHHYFNDLKSNKSTTNIKELSSIEILDADYKSLTIIINRSETKLTSPIYTAKVLFQKNPEKSILIPNLDAKNIEWSDGIYPNIIIEEDIENKGNLDLSFRKISSNNESSFVNCHLNEKEQSQDNYKFNINFQNQIVTPIYVKQKEDEKKGKDKHFLHFVVKKCKDSGNNLIDVINSMDFNKERFDGFYYQNELIIYEMEEEFLQLLKTAGHNSIHDVYSQILSNKQIPLVNLNKDEDENFWDLINETEARYTEVKSLLSKRTEVLEAFENIYSPSEEENFVKLQTFIEKAKDYLKDFSNKVESFNYLVKIDCINYKEVKIFSPFAPINLSFIIDIWDYIISLNDNNEFDQFNNYLKNQIDNSEIFKYIRSDISWFISKKAPIFGWLLYMNEKNTDEVISERFLDDLVYTKLKQLESLYKPLFSKKGQTVHIALINPSEATYLLRGIQRYINGFDASGKFLPKFHVSLIFKNANDLKIYTKFDQVFENDDNKNEMLLKNLSYTKITEEDSKANNNNFYHIIFVKDIFDVSQTSSKSMYQKESEYYDTMFGNGLLAQPLKKAIKDDAQTTNHIDYVSYNNYSLDNHVDSISRKVYSSMNRYFVQAFQSQIESNQHPLRTVRVTTNDIPFEHFDKGFMVTFLDKEIDVDIFNNKKMRDSKKPFLLDYSDFEENLGFTSHRFMTITNQKAPFNEIFKMSLEDLSQNNDITDQQIENLFDEINMLNGFWVLRILENHNDSMIKGILGTVAASKFMKRSLNNDGDYWHFIISLEEIVGVTKYKGLKEKYSDEEKYYCDDLAVISFPKNFSDDVINVTITLVEIKNSSNAEYVKKGFIQLKETNGLLTKAFVNISDKIKSLRYKEILSWLLYYRNKYQIFNSNFLNEENLQMFDNDLLKLIKLFNSGQVDVNISNGILININDDISSIEQLELVSNNYIYIRKVDFVNLLLN